MKIEIKQLLRERLLTKDEIDIRVISDFVNFAKEYLGITDDVKVELAFERVPSLTTVAYYSPNKLMVYVKDRLICDIERSLGHELTHHKQYLDGRLTDFIEDGKTGSKLENEANAIAGILVRDWGKLHPEIYYKQL